jgi:hypothetical protein
MYVSYLTLSLASHSHRSRIHRLFIDADDCMVSRGSRSVRKKMSCRPSLLVVLFLAHSFEKKTSRGSKLVLQVQYQMTCDFVHSDYVRIFYGKVVRGNLIHADESSDVGIVKCCFIRG